jgi:hypothetical protein
MADVDGTVTVGIDRPDYYNQCWFTDGYFDYVPHFLDGMAALPEMAPSALDHLIGSTSIIQNIRYDPLAVRYRSFDERATETLRLTFRPTSVCSGGELLPEILDLGSEPGWVFDASNGVVRVLHTDREVEISGK